MESLIKAWAMVAPSDDWLVDSLFTIGYLEARPLGRSLIGITNIAHLTLSVGSVCRSDFGRDFRDLDTPLPISPGRTAWVDLNALPSRWPSVDPDMDYRLVRSHSMWSQDGVHWRFGTGPDNDLGPVIPRTALADLIGWPPE